jgi:wyosine [tRNA(Phe)-imidazoG37] synthetase (radical SAM superfamily)
MADHLRYFEFNEINFFDQEQSLKKFLRESTQTEVYALKAFPPCVECEVALKPIPSAPFVWKEDTRLITNNFFYSTDKNNVKVNRAIKKHSKYISMACLDCRFFKQDVCRGLFNAAFWEKKAAIEQRLGYENYRAVQADYEKALFVFGSKCENNCRYCFDKYLPEKYLKYITDLAIEEIFYFLHYLPQPLYSICNSTHCKSGEITEYPFFDELIDCIKDFAYQVYVVTSARNLDEKKIRKLKELDLLSLDVTLISVKKEMREHYIHNAKELDYKVIIDLCKKYSIPLVFGLIAFEKLLNCGDLDNTIEKIFAASNEALVRINHPGSNHWLDAEIKKESMHVDVNSLGEKMTALYGPERIIMINNNKRDSLSQVTPVIEKIKRIIHDDVGRYLILCPEYSYEIMVSALSDLGVSVGKVTSGLGFNNAPAGILLVTDYLTAITNYSGEYTTVIIPRSSFDGNFYDISMQNIGALVRLGKEIVFL